VQPFRPAIAPGEAAREFTDRIEIAFEVGKGKFARGIVEMFSRASPVAPIVRIAARVRHFCG